MAITATDILFKLSTTGAAAGNANAGTVGASLGRHISTTQLSGTALHNLFPALTGAQNAANQVDYQCVFVHNNHATLTATAASLFLSGDVAGGAAVAIGVDPTAASAIGSASAQALQIANATTAPAGVRSQPPPPTAPASAWAISVPASARRSGFGAPPRTLPPSPTTAPLSTSRSIRRHDHGMH